MGVARASVMALQELCAGFARGEVDPCEIWEAIDLNFDGELQNVPFKMPPFWEDATRSECE